MFLKKQWKAEIDIYNWRISGYSIWPVESEETIHDFHQIPKEAFGHIWW